MKILVDADACPVKEIIINTAKRLQIEVIMVIDTSHILSDGYSKIITVDKGADSADIALINMCSKGDIVVTQDYGVAAMALGRGAQALNQNGLIYTNENIDTLLFERHIGKKIRRSGGRTHSIPKRTPADDANFQSALNACLQKIS